MLEISAQIRNLVWQLTTAEVASNQAYQTWQSAKKLQQEVDIRVKAGDSAGTEGLLAQTHSLDMHSRYINEQAKLAQNLMTYQQVTGEKQLPASVDEKLADKTHIDTTHPILAIYDQKIATLQAKQVLATYQAATPPRVSIGMKRERGDDGESFNHSLGLGVSFAFDDKVYRQPAIANAARKIADAQLARQKVELDLNANLTQLRNELALKQQQLSLNSEHNKTTQHYLALQQRAFDLGEIGLFTLLNSQKLAAESLNRKQLLQVEIKMLTANVNQALGLVL